MASYKISYWTVEWIRSTYANVSVNLTGLDRENMQGFDHIDCEHETVLIEVHAEAG